MIIFLIASEFESFVNSEECKTLELSEPLPLKFESFVNSEECKTENIFYKAETMFESFGLEI